MKLVLLNTPGIWNIGNQFINQGAKLLINKFEKNYDEVIELESLESGNLLWKYRTPFISKYGHAVLKNLKSEDVLIVIGGSCLSRYMLGLFESVKQFKCKKILLGAGFYEDIETELALYEDLPNQFDAIFMRDETSFRRLSKNGLHQNVHQGVDLALWIKENEKSILPKVNAADFNHSSVNIDSPEFFEIQRSIYEGEENPVLVWNNPSKINVFNEDKYKDFNKFVGESYAGYIRMYAKSKIVHTNRLHTFVICLLFDVPCKLYVKPQHKYHRYSFLELLGIEIEYDKLYTEEDYKKARIKLKDLKTSMINQLKYYL